MHSRKTLLEIECLYKWHADSGFDYAHGLQGSIILILSWLVFFSFSLFYIFLFFPALIHPYTQISRYSEYVRILVCTDTNNNNNNQICMAP